MADNLDDFFAKRDKKKSSKKKFDTSEDVAKVLEQRVKEKKKLETGKSNYTPEGGRQSPGPGLPAKDDDEWIEAEDLAPDFSNLKIQELILSSDDDEDTAQENKEGDESTDGPWNKKNKDSKSKEEENAKNKEKENSNENEENTEVKVSEEAPVPEESSTGDEEKKAKTKYVPPSLRKLEGSTSSATVAAPPPDSAGSGGAKYVPPSKRFTTASGAPLAPMKAKKVGAPTLEDEESFPTLS